MCICKYAVNKAESYSQDRIHKPAVSDASPTSSNTVSAEATEPSQPAFHASVHRLCESQGQRSYLAMVLRHAPAASLPPLHRVKVAQQLADVASVSPGSLIGEAESLLYNTLNYSLTPVVYNKCVIERRVMLVHLFSTFLYAVKWQIMRKDCNEKRLPATLTRSV